MRQHSFTVHQKSYCPASLHPDPIPILVSIKREYDMKAWRLKGKNRAQIRAARRARMQLTPNNRSCLKLHYYLYNFVWSYSVEKMKTKTSTVVPICCIISNATSTLTESYLRRPSLFIGNPVLFVNVSHFMLRECEVWNKSLSIIDGWIWFMYNKSLDWHPTWQKFSAISTCH